MDALVSGQKGIALLVEDQDFVSLTQGDRVRYPQNDLPNLIGDVKDTRLLNDITEDEVAQALEEALDFENARRELLDLLSPEMDEDARGEVAEALAASYQKPSYQKPLESLFFTEVLPRDSQFSSAIEAAPAPLRDLLSGLRGAQYLIRENWETWNAIPDDLFGKCDQEVARQRLIFLGYLVNQGFFRELVHYRRNKLPLANFLFACLNTIQRDEARSHYLWNYRHIIQRWLSPFEEGTKVERHERIHREEPSHKKSKRRKKRKSRDHRPHWELGDQSDRIALLQKINRQKQAIIEQMDRNDLQNVRRFAQQLIEFQMEHGGPEYISKSLCDLAMEAKQKGMLELQLELTEKSISLKPDDAWAWAQYGGALVNLHRYEDAFFAYSQAEQFGEVVVAQTGKAEIHKAQGREREALAIYDRVIAAEPDNLVALTGRAEVLKALHRYEDALSAYREMLLLHPESLFAQTGYAQVLKSQGKYEDALDAYDHIVQRHPDCVVAWAGRAEVLKVLNRLVEAHASYEKISREHPDNIVAQNGRAEILKALNRLPEALGAYEEIIERFPHEVIARNGHAEVLKKLHRLEDALTAYDRIIEDHPGDPVSRNGRADVFKRLHRYQDALNAYESVIHDHPEDVVAYNGRAEMLRLMNRLPEALKAYNSIIEEHPHNIVAKTGRAEVLHNMNRLEESLEAFDQLSMANPHSTPIRAGRANVLKHMNRLDEALEAYESLLSEESGNISARYGRAQVLKRLNRLGEALDGYEVILREQPSNFAAQKGKADVLKCLDRFDEAIDAYDLVLACNPSNLVALVGRADTLRARGRLEEALKGYNDTLNVHPYSMVARYGRAKVLRDMFRWEEARRAFTRLHQEHPHDVVTQNGLGDALKRLGRLNDAESVYTQALKDHPNHPVLQNGLALVHAGYQHWEEALALLPEREPIQYQHWVGYHIRGKIFMRIGRLNEAIPIFEAEMVQNPRPNERDHARLSLAHIYLIQEQYQSAFALMGPQLNPREKVYGDLVNVMVLGSHRRDQEAARCLAGGFFDLEAELAEIADELKRRYVDMDTPEHGLKWLHHAVLDYYFKIARAD